MFWIIFGTASFTALVISWGLMFLVSKGTTEAKEFAKRNGFCPDCGAPLLVKMKVKKQKPIGFRQKLMGFKKNE